MKSFKRAWLVARRELIDQMRDWRILMPMIILTLFFPYLMNVTAKTAINYLNQYGANMIANRMLPFLILVVGYFPVTVSLVVALEAFVGEKERGTIEPLLASPLADEHLYLGKLMAGTIVPLTVSYIGIALYMGGLTWQGILWPEWGFIAQTLALTAVQTLLMVSAAIIISTQSTTVRAANLLASFVVIPIALLIQGESALMFWGTNDVLWLAVIGVGTMSALIIRLGIVHFKRESLLGREIDMLSWNWIWQTFYKAFAGSIESSDANRSPDSSEKKPEQGSETKETSYIETIRINWIRLQNWYRVEVWLALKRLAPTFAITLTIGVAAILITYFYVNISMLNAQIPEEKLKETFTAMRSFLLDDSSGNFSAGMLFWHNLRAELVILALGIFSFGVLRLPGQEGTLAYD